ncbi:hypothetical protein K3172_02965 [Qipengyuania sp. 6B39]|uniref:hypothetical protein n=1 Tax=Qipengyuania proteolytica TaxID=2867239 RepID=UPI001C8AD1A2|nr:hypothetical protein [Qipengyuania proteolytica]MBX7494815.1 hypothetical protein [Qipengyuania proteolytica]
MTEKHDKAWFAQKTHGYGAGLPIAWQGWAILAAYVGIVLLSGLLIEWDREVGLPAAIAIMLLSTVLFTVVCAAKTRGGWRWRWGGDKER